ncbi:uncharacterized protein LOC143284938 [Babylonia areolata]|uniref:uncharacterized protein LOC143284938 n=1 Tax=Babylonia areolata TaxID=304850 RepID=UPI003FD4E10C
MEDQNEGMKLGLNLAMGFSGVLVKVQPPDPDTVQASSEGEPRGPGWAPVVRVPLPGFTVEGNAPPLSGLQKVERADPGYGDVDASAGTLQNPVNDNMFEAYRPLPQSGEHVAVSEDEFVVMYSEEEGREMAKRQRLEQADDSGSKEASDVLERPHSNAGASRGLFDRESDGEEGGMPSVVTVVDNFLTNNQDHESGDSDNRVRPAASLSLVENGSALSDEQRSLDEIEVLEGGYEDFQEGEMIKDFAQSRLATNSETFLSQMRFFGGRTWARGRGRRRGCGRGQRDVTNIALKLIETDQTETDSEQGTSLDDVDQVKNMTDSVRRGRGKSSGGRSGPASPLRKSTRVPESKEPDVPPSPADVEHHLRKESARGRGRAAGRRGWRARRGVGRGKPKMPPPPPAAGSVDDISYESNDEDMKAAIKASLADMNQNTNKTDEEKGSKDDSSLVDESKVDENSKQVYNPPTADSPEMDDKPKKSADNSKKDSKARKGDSVQHSEKEKKAGSMKKVEGTQNLNKNSDQTKVGKTAFSKCKAKNTPKGKKWKLQTKDKPDKEIAKDQPEAEVEYESNNEETQLAIKASLEELVREKERQKEREHKEEEVKKGRRKKLTKGGGFAKKKEAPTLTQTGAKDEDNCPALGGKLSPASLAKRLSSVESKAKVKQLKRRGRQSARLSDEPKPSTSTEGQTVSPQTSPSKLTQLKMQNISMKLNNRLQSSVDNSGKKQNRRSSDVSDFDSVVDTFLDVEESPCSTVASHTPDMGPRGKGRRGAKRKGSLDDSSSVDISMVSDDETPGDTRASSNCSSFLYNTNPVVKLQKLHPSLERPSSQCSSHSAFKKRGRGDSDHEQDAGPSKSKVTRRSSGLSGLADQSTVRRKPLADHPAASSPRSHMGSSVIKITPDLDSPGLSSAEGKSDSLTKSVGGMLSYLFGDKLSEECPNGFAVNVRLEVEKKKDDDGGNSINNSGGCCKSKNPELCPCLRKVPDARLAAVLKERVENRRDLTVGAKGALLAAILNFMQELEVATDPN